MGEILEFKRPEPKMPSKKPIDASIPIVSSITTEETADSLPRKVLEDVLEFADDIADILIMVRGTDGTLGFVTSTDGFESSLALIESVKFGMLLNNAVNSGYNPGTGDTPPKGSA